MGKEEDGQVRPVQVDQKQNVKGIGFGTEGAFEPWWDDLYTKTAIGTKIKSKKDKKSKKPKKSKESKKDKKSKESKKLKQSKKGEKSKVKQNSKKLKVEKGSKKDSKNFKKL